MNTLETYRQFFNCHAAELRRIAAAAFRHLGLEAREEAIQNALALAWKSFRALILKGRAGEPGILQSALWYSIRQTWAGRQAHGDSRAKDTYQCARKGKIQFERLELSQFVSDDTPVPDQVSFRLDVPAFLTTLTGRQQRMAEALMIGHSTLAVANQFRVTPGAVSQFRQRFKHLFDLYFAA